MSGVRSELLLATEAVCVLPSTHPLAARQVIEPHDLDGETFIALTRRHSGRFAIDQAMERAGVKPRTIIETATSLSAGEFVREGRASPSQPVPDAGQLGPSRCARSSRASYRTSFLMAARPSRPPRPLSSRIPGRAGWRGGPLGPVLACSIMSG